jgi:hypothetical protein
MLNPRAEAIRSHRDLERPAVVLCCLVALRDGPLTVGDIAERYNRDRGFIYKVLNNVENLFSMVNCRLYGKGKFVRWELTSTGKTIAEAIK